MKIFTNFLLIPEKISLSIIYDIFQTSIYTKNYYTKVRLMEFFCIFLSYVTLKYITCITKYKI